MDGIRLFATINNGNTVTLDLNGKNALESSNGIELFNNSTLKLIGTGSIAANGSSSNSFRMLSGTLDLSGWTGGNIGTVYVWSGTLKPPAQGGIAKLELNEEGTRLSGGWYGNIIRFSGATSEPAGNFLDGGCAFRKADGSFVNYDQKITQYEGIENVTVVPCPHEKLPDSLSGRNCPYCNTILAALVETADGVKGCADPQAAVDKAQGGTVVLLIDLKDNAGTLTVSKPCTLDLNGHTVETLTVTGDVTLESLLPEGYAYKTGSRWVSEPSGKTLTDVTMALVPFKDLRAENDNVTISYGQTATLKALVTGYGKTPTMQWSQKTNGTYAPISGETGDTLTLSGLTAGSYVYRFTYNVDGYYKSVDFTVTVEKATVQVTTAPTAVLNLVYTGENQTLITPGAADKGTMYYTIGRNGNHSTDLPTALLAGTYQVYYYALPTDRDNYIPSEPQYIEVTVAPRPVQDLTVQLLGEPFPYDGTSKTQKVKVTLGDVDVTSQIHVLGNTAAKAGSYNMTLQATGGNLTGSKLVPWSVAPKSVTAQVTVGDKDFDGTREAAVERVTLTGVLAGDAVAVQAGKVSFAHAAPGTWEVTLEKLTLTGADAGNYSLVNPQPQGLTATIRANERCLDLSQTFTEGTEVTINGKKQTVSNDGGSFVDLPQEAEILTTYETNGSYPTGMRVYRILREKDGARLEEIPEFQNLLQYAGSSIRLTGTKGIRMITALDGATKAALTGAGLAGFTLEEYGTVVAKKSILGDNDLTLETGKHNFAYKKGVSDPVFGDAGNLTQYTNVLVGFSLEDCKEELVMRPYILLRDENGEVHTVYGGVVTRSIGYIAKQNENTYRPGTDGYSYIHEIIAAVYGQG
ncbi:MAG: YDG domain-containing protein [Candidatus Faecousia sp.]|nr:YDG domain-containing protein [Candidatus Faecousia sp.]